MLILGILVGIKSTVPYYWGNKYITKKMNYYASENKEYNCLFFGSSKVIHHINPILFDSLTGYHSYNFGAPHTFFLETHYLLELFLTDYNQDATNIFIDKKNPKIMAYKNYHTGSSKYYLDFKRAKMGISYFYKEGNYEQVYMPFISYVENLLCIGELKAIFEFHRKPRKQTPYWASDQQRGYYPLEQMAQRKKRETIT